MVQAKAMGSHRGRLKSFGLSFLGFFAAALIVVLLINPGSAYQPDIRQAIYRYAEQLRAGNGLVFNSGERILLIPAPLYMLLLASINALLSPLGVSVVVAGEIIFALSIAIGAIAVMTIASHAQLPRLIAVFIAGIYSLSWPLWNGIGTAYPFASGLCLLAMALALEERWRWAGLAAAAATLCVPEASIVALLVGVWAVNKNAAVRYGFPLIVTLLCAGLAIRLYYGPDWWTGLLILKDNALPGSDVDWSTLLLVLLLLALGVKTWYENLGNPAIALSGVWIVVYVLVITGLLRVAPIWHYSLLVGPLLILAAVSLQKLSVRQMRYSALPGVVLLAILVVGVTLQHLNDLPARPITTTTFRQQANTVGFASARQALMASIPLTQSITAFDGQFQPDLKAMVERGDTQAILIRYAPVVVVLGGGRIQPNDLADGVVRVLDYRPTANAGIFERFQSVGSFTTYRVNAAFGPDIHLLNVSLDQTTLSPGQPLRIQLDWQGARPASYPVSVDLRLRSGDYLLAHVTDTYEPRLFSGGSWSTYHILTVLKSAWGGPVVLELAVIVSDGTIGRIPIATLNISAR